MNGAQVARLPLSCHCKKVKVTFTSVSDRHLKERMKRKILVIEDNEQNRYLVTFLLEANGYEVVSATDGLAGIALANTMNPALILLDIQLPGMNGYVVAQKLRANPALDDVPIVAVTSYAMVGDQERALVAGCTGYIEKPINPDTFIAEIEVHLPDYLTPTGGIS